LADVPSHTAAQYHERLEDFRRRLEAILADLNESGVLPILVIPPGNDAGFEPSRSLLPPQTPRAVRATFSQAVLEARSLESRDPEEGMKRYRALLTSQPGFAEIHFRLARLLEAKGAYAEAYEEYVMARDLDGHPMRCPSAFQELFRELGARHNAILVDGQAVLHARHPNGLLDDSLFNDGLHPSLEGYVALAEGVLSGLHELQAFGWSSSLPVPKIDLVECANHFDLTTATWKEVCRFASGFYRTTRSIRFDPTERDAKAAIYEEGLEKLEAGKAAESLGISGIGVRPLRSKSGTKGPDR
jgi:hypothetical protein